MPTYADINTRMTAAVTALDAGDYSAAKIQATAAQALMAIIPDSEKRANVSASLEFDREGIERFIRMVDKLMQDAAAAFGVGGLEVVPIVYGETKCYMRGECDDGC